MKIHKKKKNIFLLEIGTEELPTKFIIPLYNTFKKNIKKALILNKCVYQKINYFLTPRRLSVKIKDIRFLSNLQTTIINGPSIKIAFDKNKNLTKAALCWAKKNNIDLTKIKIKKKKTREWLYYKKIKKKEKIEKILPIIAKQSIENIPISKKMQWNKKRIKFLRPVRNITILLNEKVLPKKILGIQSNRFLYGNISSGKEKIKINHAKDYPDILLKKCNIIASKKKRKKRIKKEISKLINKENKKIKLNKKLLLENTLLVESPSILIGSFKKKYLVIPSELIINIIEKYQKCFALYNKNFQLTSSFINISNIRNKIAKKNKKIIQTNEKIINSRLSDVYFFLKKDQEQKLIKYFPKLKNITFHEKLGTIYEKSLRIKKISQFISHLLKIKKNISNIIQKAAILLKCDLATQLVFEFPEMQGTAGMYYFLKNEANKKIALCIKNHYKPIDSNDSIPATLESSILSISDKIDTITGFFSIFKTPQSKKDPFGLRRLAIAIIRIIIKKKISINLGKLIKKSIKLYIKKINIVKNKKKKKIIKKKIIFFFQKRLISWYKKKKYNTKIINSINNLKKINLVKINKKIKIISLLQKQTFYFEIFSIYKRIKNIIKNQNNLNQQKKKIKTKLIKKKEEINLYKKFYFIKKNTKLLIKKKKFKKAFLLIFSLKKYINDYFNKITIFHQEKKIKINRMLLLKKIKKYLRNYFILK